MEPVAAPKTGRMAIHSLLFLIVFFAGGFAGYALSMQGRPEERPGGRYRENPGKFESEAAERISRKYELSPEASQKLHEAIRRNGEKLRKLSEEFQPRFQECFRELNEEIRSLIPEERRAEFDEDVKRMRSRMPFERRPGGMDNGRRGGREGREGEGRPHHQGERGADAKAPAAPAAADEEVSPLRGVGPTRINGFTGPRRHEARDGRPNREVRGQRDGRHMAARFAHGQHRERGQMMRRGGEGAAQREQMMHGMRPQMREQFNRRGGERERVQRGGERGQMHGMRPHMREQFNRRGGEREKVQRGGERGQMMRRGGEGAAQREQMMHGMRPQMREQFNRRGGEREKVQRGGERGQMMRRGGEGAAQREQMMHGMRPQMREQFNRRGGERERVQRGGERGQMHGMRPQMREQFNRRGGERERVQRGGERGQMMRRGGEGAVEQPAREHGERPQVRPNREAIRQMRALVPAEKQAEFDRILREMLAPAGDAAKDAPAAAQDGADRKEAGEAQDARGGDEAPVMRYRVRPLEEGQRGGAPQRERR